MVKEYSAFRVVSGEQLDRYTNEGWEIVGKEAQEVAPYHFNDVYHVGYPIKRLVEDLKNLLAHYEAHGLDQQLFEYYAETHGEKVEEISQSGLGVGKETRLAAFMNHYYLVSRNEKTNFKWFKTKSWPGTDRSSE